MKNQITVCIDGSNITQDVCVAAAWVSTQLNVPLTLLHVLEKENAPNSDDLSGAIGLDSRQHLLAELASLDAKRNKLAIEHGRLLLSEAKTTTEQHGAQAVSTEQRHDHFLDAISDYEANSQLFIIGRRGKGHEDQTATIGSHVENMVRSIHTPILMATTNFLPPTNFMLAYDGSDTSIRAIERLSETPLLKALTGHIVMVGDNSSENQQKLEYAHTLLTDRGFDIERHLLQGQVIPSLVAFQEKHNIQLKVMGAYGHSRIREFIVGSNTTKMLSTSTVPVFILR